MVECVCVCVCVCVRVVLGKAKKTRLPTAKETGKPFLVVVTGAATRAVELIPTLKGIAEQPVGQRGSSAGGKRETEHTGDTPRPLWLCVAHRWPSALPNT
jgi:hypothetical protein